MANDPYAGLDDAVADTLHQTAQATAGAVRNNVVSVQGTSPDRSAEYGHLARFVGVPVDTVEADPTAIKQQAALQSMDADKLVQEAPHTARLMTDLQSAKVMHDDVPGTAAVEQAVKQIPLGAQVLNSLGANARSLASADGYDSSAPVALLKGLGGSFNKLGQFAGLVGSSVPTLWDKSYSLLTGQYHSSASDWAFSHWVKPFEDATPAFDLRKDATGTETAFHTVGNLVGTLSQIVLSGGGGAAVAPVAGESVAGAVGAQVAHSAKAMALPAMSDMVNTAQTVYAQTGDMQAAAEAAQMQYFTSTMSGIVPLGLTGGAPTRLASGFMSGAVTSEASRQLMNAAMPDAMQQQFDLGQLVMGGLSGAVMGGVMGHGQEPSYHDAIRQTYVEAAKAEQAQHFGDAIASLGQTAEASKLRERDPEAFRQFVQTITDDGHLQDVYVKGAELQNALDQSGIDPAKVQAALPDMVGQMREALATNGDVRIPVSDYATHIAGGPMDAALLPHLRGDPDGMTYKEAQQYFQDTKAGMQDHADKIVVDHLDDEAAKARAQVVYQHISDQLTAANRFPASVNNAYAAMARDFYTTTAGRLGMHPDELLARYPLEVKAEAMEGPQTLDQPPKENTPSDELKNAVVKEIGVYNTKTMLPAPEGSKYLAAVQKKTNRGFFVIDGNLDRDTFKKLVAERDAAGLATDKMYIYGDLAPYTGQGIDFMKLSDFAGGSPKNKLDQAKRGSISFGDDITKQPSVISLLKDADLSTALHEFGHFFLEVQNDIARRPDAPEQIKGDMQKTLDWFGVKDSEAWNRMTLEEKRESHEKFARGFEAYLMEGKAPTVEQQGLFSRFRSWLVNVYQSLSNLHVELTSEVRGVFDRMLASDEAIKTAEKIRGYEPLFTTAEAAGMTPEAFEAYRSLGAEATQNAIQAMDERSMRDMKWLSNAKSKAIKALQKEAAAERLKIKEQVTSEVMAEPVNRARTMLKTGKLLDAEGKELPDTRPLGAPELKLDPAALKEMYPEGALGRPDLTKLRGLTGKGGMHPDMVAERVGIQSGHDLVRQLTEGENAKDKIDGLTDQRMLEQHGELTDPQSIERAAEASIHTDARAKFMATGLKILTKSPIPAGEIARAAKEAAEAAVSAKRVKELLPAQYAAAEGRSNKEAIKKAPTKPEEAVAAQRAALLNNRLFKATTDAVAEVQKAVKFLTKFNKDSVRAKIDVDIRDQIDDLLSRFDFRQSVPKDPTRAQVNLQTWIDSQRAAGYQPVFIADMVDPTVREHFKDMTVEQVRGLRDTIAALEHIGKVRKTAMIGGERLSVDDYVKNQLVPKMQERGDNFTAAQLLDRPEDRVNGPVALALEKFKSYIRGLQASLKPQEFKRNMFDNHELLGPFGKALFEPVFDATYHKIDMLKGMSDDFGAKVDELGKAWQKSLADQVENTTLLDPDKTADAGEPIYMRINRGRMIGMALHVGNESNFDKMTKGWGWEPAKVWQFLHDNMTHNDWKAVQAVWDGYEKHFPAMVDMARRLGNTAPDKIEPRPFPTKFGEMPGGYAALKYDALRSRRGEKEQAGVAINPEQGLFGRDYFRPDTTTNGSMNARVDGYIDRVDLDYHHIARTMHESIHDLAYRETLIDANKIIEHPDFRRQFKKTFGPEAYKSLRDWIGQTANSENADHQVAGWGSFLAHTRTGIVMTGIALRVSTVLKHGGSAGIKTTGFFLGGGEKYLASRMASMATDYRNQISGAQEKFSEIRARLLQRDRDFKVGSKSLFEPESLQSKGERFGHAAVAWSDMMTAVPTAWAAYDRAITEGIPKNQGGTGAPMTEAQAVAYANKIVREAHGSNIETARSMTLNSQNEAIKMFTTMYGFMNTSYGQALDGWDKLHTAGISNPAVFARSFMALIVPAIWAAVLTQGGPKKDESPGFWAAKAITGEVAGMVPFVRDAYSMAEGFANAGQVGPEAWMHTIVQALKDTVHLAQGKPVKAPIKDIANAAGMGLHIPGLGQLGTSAQYLADVHAGKERPANAWELAKGVALGHSKQK